MFGVSLVLGHLSPLYAKVQFETVYVAEQQDKISSPSNNPKVRMGTSKEYHYLLKEVQYKYLLQLLCRLSLQTIQILP